MSLPWLHLDGQWIRDEAGNRIAIRGVGMDYVAYEHWDWREQFMQQIKNRGYNSVRLAFSIAPWDAHHKPYNAAWLKESVDLAEQYGLYAILTCMTWWASEEVQGWEQPLPNHEQVWLDVWAEIVSNHKNRSAVLAYELYNEPLGVGLTPDGKGIYECYMDCISVIRQIDDVHPVILYDDHHFPFHVREEQAGLADRTIFDPSNKPSNAIFSSHHWWPEGGTAIEDFAGAYRQAAGYVEGLSLFRDWLNAPVWAGEFGTYDYGDYSHANWEYIRDVIRICEALGIPWNYWQMEAFVQYAPDALVNITPVPYTSSIYASDIPRPFISKPFNLWDHIVDKFWAIGGVDQHRWSTTWMSLPGSVFWVVLSGPISVRRKVWGGPDKYNYPLISDEVIIVPEGETARVEGGAGYTEIYAEEDLAEKIFHSLTVETTPISGVPFTIIKVS